jgi:hypothetical protein
MEMLSSCSTQNPILKTKKSSPNIFELKYHVMILILFLKLTSPRTKIISNKDLIKVPLYDFSYCFVNIYLFSKEFYKLEIIFLKIPILYFSVYEMRV